MNMKRVMMIAALAAILGGLCSVTALADAPTLSVENVTFRQRYPWNGLVDIDVSVNCSDPTTNISLYVSAKNTAANAGGDASLKKQPVRRVKKPGRNDPCPCGKKRPNGLPMKYKDCCGRNE